MQNDGRRKRGGSEQQKWAQICIFLLYIVQKLTLIICKSCTEKQPSTAQITQFYNLTEINVEINPAFVYNVLIAVPGTLLANKRGQTALLKGV